MPIDNVNNPPHYQMYYGLEVIDLTEQMNFNRGNAIKYICRAGFKSGGSEKEDLRKAIWYLRRELDRIERTRNLIEPMKFMDTDLGEEIMGS